LCDALVTVADVTATIILTTTTTTTTASSGSGSHSTDDELLVEDTLAVSAMVHLWVARLPLVCVASAP
jgi:hypothetical protein